MPYFCHTGNHLYVNGPDGAEGCHEPACVEFRAVNVPPLGPLLGTVPGGFNDTRGDARYDFQKDFDKGLNQYKKARDEGLKPKATTVAAVKAAHEEVRSHRRAVKKLKKMGVGAGELQTVKGVN